MTTISEANAINQVLGYLLNRPRDFGRGFITDEQALDAATFLADRAYKPLMAGLRTEDVRRAWPGRRVPASTSSSCPAHGAHPHDGGVCLDCPDCRPACGGERAR